MLLVNIHQLDIVLAYPVRLGALEHEVDGIGRVVRLQRQHVLVLSSPQHLGQRDQVDAQRDVAVAPVGREPFGAEQHGHQRHVRVVHRLQSNSGVIAVEIAILHQILDSVCHLQVGQFLVSLSSFSGGVSFFLGPRTRLRRLACSRRASNTDLSVNIHFLVFLFLFLFFKVNESRDQEYPLLIYLLRMEEGEYVKIKTRMCVCVEGN